MLMLPKPEAGSKPRVAVQQPSPYTSLLPRVTSWKLAARHCVTYAIEYTSPFEPPMGSLFCAFATWSIMATPPANSGAPALVPPTGCHPPDPQPGAVQYTAYPGTGSASRAMSGTTRAL